MVWLISDGTRKNIVLGIRVRKAGMEFLGESRRYRAGSGDFQGIFEVEERLEHSLSTVVWCAACGAIVLEVDMEAVDGGEGTQGLA